MCPSDGQGGWLIERFARRVTRCHLAMSSGSTNLLLKARNMDRSARNELSFGDHVEGL